MMTRTTKNPLVGKRVEIPCYTDTWMMGARYGTITWKNQTLTVGVFRRLQKS